MALYIRTFLALITIWLSGCVAEPQKLPLSGGEKVGIMLGDFPTELTHSHIGVTGFNNFNKNFPATINFGEYSRDKLIENFKKNGVDAVVLDASPSDIKLAIEAIDIPVYFTMAPHLNAEKSKSLPKLKEKYGVDVLLVINTEGRNVNTDTTLINSSPLLSGAYGIFSNTSMIQGRDYYYYYFPVVRIMNLNPTYRNSTAKVIEIKKDNYIKLDDVDNITENDMKKVELEIKNGIDAFIVGVVKFSLSKDHYNYDRECNCLLQAGY